MNIASNNNIWYHVTLERSKSVGTSSALSEVVISESSSKSLSTLSVGVGFTMANISDSFSSLDFAGWKIVGPFYTHIKRSKSKVLAAYKQSICN